MPRTATAMLTSKYEHMFQQLRSHVESTPAEPLPGDLSLRLRAFFQDFPLTDLRVVFTEEDEGA